MSECMNSPLWGEELEGRAKVFIEKEGLSVWRAPSLWRQCWWHEELIKEAATLLRVYRSWVWKDLAFPDPAFKEQGIVQKQRQNKADSGREHLATTKAYHVPISISLRRPQKWSKLESEERFLIHSSMPWVKTQKARIVFICIIYLSPKNPVPYNKTLDCSPPGSSVYGFSRQEYRSA